jgi:hypothetical protein
VDDQKPAIGQRTIDAYVTEIFTTVMPSGEPRPSSAEAQAEPTR